MFLSPEYGACLKYSVKYANHHLFVELWALRKYCRFVEVADLEKALATSEAALKKVDGAADMTVEAKDSQELAGKLRSVGVETTLVWLSEAGHLAPLVALRAPGRQPALMPAIRAFLHLPAKP